MKMSPEAKAKFIQDLRTTTIRQTRGRMIREDGSCCANGLLAVTQGGFDPKGDDIRRLKYEDVAERCGISVQAQSKLITWNDWEIMSFSQIANEVEKSDLF